MEGFVFPTENKLWGEGFVFPTKNKLWGMSLFQRWKNKLQWQKFVCLSDARGSGLGGAGVQEGLFSEGKANSEGGGGGAGEFIFPTFNKLWGEGFVFP